MDVVMVTFLPVDFSKANFPKLSSFLKCMISLEEHLDHYPHCISSKEVSSITSRYPSFPL